MTRRAACTSALAIAIAGTGHAAARDAATGPVAAEAMRSPAGTPADGDLAGIQDIIVTAQRRTESLQKTALTIEVLQSKLLADAGVTNPLQLTTVAPSLQISSAGAATSVYLRGVGAYATTAGTSPAIPYYTDGVYLARTQGLVAEFYDVDRLEVLKGPQGTLYGRNASGGAINVLTRRPKLGVLEARADIELGNYGDQTGEAAINVPIGDTVALRASGQVVDKGGFTSDGLSDDVHQAGRLKLLWEPSSAVSLLLNGSYGHIGGRGQGWVALNKDVPGWYPWLDITSPQGQAYVLAHGFIPVPGATRPSTPDEAKQNLNFYTLSGQLDVRLSSDVTLTVIPAYRYSRMQYTGVFSATYYDGYGFADVPAQPETSKATSVEARLGGDTEQLKWVAGVYFYNEDQFEAYSFDAGNASNGASVDSFGTRSYAAFGQATFTVTHGVRLIGGLRYTSDRRSLSDGAVYLISPVVFFAPPSPGLVPCGFPAPTQPKCVADRYSGAATYHNVSWKVGAEADVLDDGLLYATASRGFKAGGFNFLSAAGSPGSAQPFRPEQLTAYEVGLKDRFLNNRLQVSVAGFYWDYKDHQEPYLAFTAAGTLNQVYFNAGSTETYGGSVDVVARPWTGGTFTGSVEYVHSRYKNFTFDVPSFTVAPGSTGCRTSPSVASPYLTTIDCSGFESVKTPAWTGGARFTQEIAVGDGRLLPTAGVTVASSRWLNSEFTPIERARGYAMLDAAVTYEFPGNRLSLTGFVRNINNAKAYSTAFVNPVAATVTANIAAPRTFGARLSIDLQ